MSAQVAVKGVARLVQEAGGSIGVVGDRRGDEQRLVGGAFRQPHVLHHPAALELHVLVLAAPAGVGTLEQVDEAFAFLRLVGVVIHADDVPEIVEGDLLEIADAGGEDLETRTVGFATQHGAGMRERELSSFLADDVGALVTDGPIDTPVWSETQAVHVVAGVSDMSAEAGRDEFLDVGYAVTVGVLEPPDVGDGGDVDPTVEIQHPGGDPGDG